MTELIETLHDLAQICCDGEAFYRDAAEKMQDKDLRAAIAQVGEVRAALCRDFLEILRARGEEPSGSGTLYGALHKLYTDVRAHFSADGDRIYIAELEEAEDRLLHAMEAAMLTLEPAEARAVLRRYLPAARAAHERMRSMKRESTA